MSKSDEVYRFENARKAKMQRDAAARIEMDESGAELHDGPLPKDAVYKPQETVTFRDLSALIRHQAEQRGMLGTPIEQLQKTVIGRHLRELPPWLISFVREENLLDANLELIRQHVTDWEESNRANRWKQGRAVAVVVAIQTARGGLADDVYAMNWGGLKRSRIIQLAGLARVFPASCERPDISLEWYSTLYSIAKIFAGVEKPKTRQQWDDISGECQVLFKKYIEHSTAQLKDVLLDLEKYAKPREPQVEVEVDEETGEVKPIRRRLYIDDEGGIRLVNPDGTLGHSVSWRRLFHETGLRGQAFELVIEPLDVDVVEPQGPEDQFDV